MNIFKSKDKQITKSEIYDMMQSLIFNIFEEDKYVERNKYLELAKIILNANQFESLKKLKW